MELGSHKADKPFHSAPFDFNLENFEKWINHGHQHTVSWQLGTKLVPMVSDPQLTQLKPGSGGGQLTLDGKLLQDVLQSHLTWLNRGQNPSMAESY